MRCRASARAGVIAGSTVTRPHCLVRGWCLTESTALRRAGLEEEGEKNRAAAVTVKIADEVALYILNQKRRELSRIETEHGMQISFEPKEGLAAGTFELERTKSRDPGERPRPSAVGIEAGFVPSEEPEPDFPEELDEEEVEAEGTRRGRRQEALLDRPRSARKPRRRGVAAGAADAGASIAANVPTRISNSRSSTRQTVKHRGGRKPQQNGQQAPSNKVSMVRASRERIGNRAAAPPRRGGAVGGIAWLRKRKAWSIPDRSCQ